MATDPGPTRARRWARRLFATLLGALVAVPLAELGARLAGPVAGEELFYGGMNPPPNGLFRGSASLIKEPTPGFSGVREAIDDDIPIRINSLGLRGPEPGTGRPRWLALGDSFVLAAQVREEDTFVTQLGEKLGVEVLNAGVDEYSTVQEMRRYLQLDPLVGTSVVIAVFFLGNDLNDNVNIGTALAEMSLHPQTGPLPELHTSFERWLFSHSVLAAYAHVAKNRSDMLSGAAGSSAQFKAELKLWSYEGKAELDQKMRYTRSALEGLRDAVASRGDRLLVAVAPPAYYVDRQMMAQLLGDFGVSGVGTDGPRDAVMATLSELGIASCDLTPGMRAALESGLRPYLRYDGHWNRIGHRVAAEEITRCYRRDEFERRRSAEAGAR